MYPIVLAWASHFHFRLVEFSDVSRKIIYAMFSYGSKVKYEPVLLGFIYGHSQSLSLLALFLLET